MRFGILGRMWRVGGGVVCGINEDVVIIWFICGGLGKRRGEREVWELENAR